MDAYSFLEQLFFPNIKLYFVALYGAQNEAYKTIY